MDSLAPVFELLLRSLPSSLNHLRIRQFVIDSIATKYDIVIVIFNLETLNVWRGNDNLRVTLIFSSLGLDVAKGARD